MLEPIDHTKLSSLEVDLFTAFLLKRRAGQSVVIAEFLDSLPADRRDEMKRVLEMAVCLEEAFAIVPEPLVVRAEPGVLERPE